MTVHPKFQLTACATVKAPDFAQLRPRLLQQAQKEALALVNDSATGLCLQHSDLGQFKFSAKGENLQLQIYAGTPDCLNALKTRLADLLSDLLPLPSAPLKWTDETSGKSQTGTATMNKRAPNLRSTTVHSVTPVGAAFVRVRIQAQDLSAFGAEAIHFRLCLPPAGCDQPEWPVQSENGSLSWPKGDKALHRPVYTTRWIDPKSGLMDFDVFLHEGGRVTEWVQQVAPGDPLTIIGPGGGGVPQTNKILMYGDETAFPAIARILESLPARTTGAVTLVAKNGADCAYPISAPSGIDIRWLRHCDATDLADQALKAKAAHPDHFFWFAAEKSHVTAVRAVLKETRPAPDTSYIAAYWSQE